MTIRQQVNKAREEMGIFMLMAFLAFIFTVFSVVGIFDHTDPLIDNTAIAVVFALFQAAAAYIFYTNANRLFMKLFELNNSMHRDDLEMLLREFGAPILDIALNCSAGESTSGWVRGRNQPDSLQQLKISTMAATFRTTSWDEGPLRWFVSYVDIETQLTPIEMVRQHKLNLLSASAAKGGHVRLHTD